jgi:hypothetical protein
VEFDKRKKFLLEQLRDLMRPLELSDRYEGDGDVPVKFSTEEVADLSRGVGALVLFLNGRMKAAGTMDYAAEVRLILSQLTPVESGLWVVVGHPDHPASGRLLASFFHLLYPITSQVHRLPAS